ncbi:MAG: spermidine/putrescine ABC transporter permease PotC [Syntrophobacteraceae bacterium]
MWGKRLASNAYCTLIYLFLYMPMVVLAAYSFNQSTYSLEWKGFTLDWYVSLIEDDGLWSVALNSLTIAALSASLATVLGTFGTIALYRYQFVGKRLLYGLTYVLIMSPEIVMGISLLILFVALNIPLGFGSLLLSHVTFCVPFVIVTVHARISGFDKNLVEVAKDLGASELQTLRLVILPLLAPAILAGWLLSFTLSMDDVIISFFVTGPGFEILPLKIYSMVRMGVKPEINALCTLMFSVTLVLVIVAQRLQKENR